MMMTGTLTFTWPMTTVAIIFTATKGTAKEMNPNVNTPKQTQTSLDAGFYENGDPAET